MAKHNNEEAFYQRMRDLAETKKPQLKESSALGTLIDYKRAANGVAYGIIKENHHYYIKKGGLKKTLNVADFAYIGGMANITENQYKSVAVADKQRNMILSTVNEATGTKVSKTGSKKKVMLTEDKAGKEIEMAASKVGDLDAATDAAAVPAMDVAPEGATEMDAGIDAMPPEGGEEPIPAPEGGEEMPPMDVDGIEGEEGLPAEDGIEGGEEGLPAVDGMEGGEEEVAVEDPESEATREIEKSLGKLTNTLRKTELTEPQVKSYVNSFLSAFKDDFPDIDIEDRKAMAEKITKVVPQEDIEDLSGSVEDVEGIESEEIPVEEPELAEEEEQCAECGGFAKYAESRGHDAESMMNCDDEEMANVMSGYANGHEEGQNDGDFKAIALFITPEILEKLKSDYGHDDFANQVEPFSKEMNETPEEDKIAQINELFGGLKQLGKAAGQGIKQGAQAVKQGAMNIGQDIADKAGQVKQGVQNAATGIKQTYHAGEKNAALGKLEKVAADLGKQIAAVNNQAEKAGQEPINVKSILSVISNQVGSAAGIADLSKYRTNEEGIPVDHTGVQPMMEEAEIEEQVDIKVSEKAGKKLSPEKAPEVEMKEAEEIEGGDIEGVDIDSLDVDGGEEKIASDEPETGDDVLDLTKQRQEPEMDMQAGFESMGGGVVKPDGTPTTVEVTKDSVKVEMNENEAKLRKYVRNRLEEKVGLRKANLNEDKKSKILEKLDRTIDKQLGLFENVAMKKVNKVLEKK